MSLFPLNISLIKRNLSFIPIASVKLANGFVFSIPDRSSSALRFPSCSLNLLERWLKVSPIVDDFQSGSYGLVYDSALFYQLSSSCSGFRLRSAVLRFSVPVLPFPAAVFDFGLTVFTFRSSGLSVFIVFKQSNYLSCTLAF